MFAAKRTPRDMALKIWLIVSTITNNGPKARGAPVGINKLKKSNLNFKSPITVIAIIIVKENPNVNIICAVEENMYGNSPNTFKEAINKNIESMKGKNL